MGAEISSYCTEAKDSYTVVGGYEGKFLMMFGLHRKSLSLGGHCFMSSVNKFDGETVWMLYEPRAKE